MLTKNQRYIFIGIIILLLILWSMTAEYSEHPLRSAVSQIASAPVVDELTVLGINLPSGGTITPEDVEAGKYPIEAVNVGNNTYIIDGAHRYGRYWRFDTNKDGIIDDKDPMYLNLAMGIINPEDKTIRFIPWKDAGIRGLILDPNHLTAETGGELPAGFWAVHSTIVTSDGFKWLTFHVPVSTKFVDQLKTSDPNQRIVETSR